MKLKRSTYGLCYYQIVIFIISHLWSGTDSELVPGYSIKAPLRVTVQRGLCVYIPCTFTVPETVPLTINAAGIWFKRAEGDIVASKTNSRRWSNGRFSLTGDVWRGDCSLYIEDPSYDDEGHYLFRIEDKIKFHYQDIQPYVEVTELKSKPEISPIESWLDGEEVTLRCTFPGICLWMNPQITWEGNIQNRRVYNRVTNHENGTKSHISTLAFTARKEHNNSTLSCTVWLRGGLTTRQQITIKVESQSKTISDVKTYCKTTGNHIKCTCMVQSFSETFIRWKINDKFYDSSDKDLRITTSRSDMVTNSTLSLQLSQTDIPHIMCISSNKLGDSDPDLPHVKSSSDYRVIVGVGILIIVMLIALGVFWNVKRSTKKELGNNDMYEFGDVKGTESIYQDLQNPTNSIYDTIIGSQQ